MHLSPYDYFLIVLYFGGIVALGLYFRRYVQSSEDYFLAGKMLPFWAIAMSIVVADVAAIDFVALTGQAYRYGIVAANFDWIGSIPAMILAGLIFIPYYWRAGVFTIPEYLGRRYNFYVQSAAAVVWLVIAIFSLGGLLWGTGILMSELFGWPPELAIGVTVVVAGVFTVVGGLSAVVMTDVVQLILMFVGSIAILILGFWEVGGWSGLLTKVHALGTGFDHHFDLIRMTDENTPYPWTGIFFGLALVLAPAYFIGNQTIVQRTLGARDEWNAKASMLMGAFLKMFVPVLMVFPGLIALALNPGLADGDRAFPMMIKTLLPTGMIGLIVAAFFAGLVSKVESGINSTATVFTKDVYEKFLKKNASDKHYLLVGRIVTGLVLVLAVVISPLSAKFPGIYVYFQTINSFIQGPMFALLLLGMMWKRTTAWGGMWALIGGLVLSIGMYIMKDSLFTIQEPFLYISWWSFLGSVIICVVVSYLTKPKPIDELRGLVYGLYQKDHELQSVLKQAVGK